ncbi:HNH endonuclease family protein [Xanthomonas phage OP1]|uniref:HNH endonuclease family protein n=1 Tax=Xanthomonas phage OP1 TaxID=2994040 RepID=Q2NPE1_9CAUD|nr:HNH endonuclease [Xanthomonas phage OP1]BAE72755.1 HNH endonuclease family protein [Xanthomonas phage OP1]
MKTYLTREKNGSWRVRIGINGERVHLGYYASIDKALDAIALAKKLHRVAEKT